MGTIGERITAIRKTLGLNQKEFADKLNIRQATVSTYEVGRSEPDIETMLKIAKLGFVTLDWLLTGVESTFKPPLADTSQLASNVSQAKGHWYPVIGKVRAGLAHVYEDEDVVGTLFIDYYKKNSCFCLVVEGDSMEPVLKPGDLVLIDPSETPLSGDTVVAVVSGRQMIKKLVKTKGGVELHSHNTQYPPIFVNQEETELLYRVVLVQPRLVKL